jgi:hypothetical protein
MQLVCAFLAVGVQIGVRQNARARFSRTPIAKPKKEPSPVGPSQTAKGPDTNAIQLSVSFSCEARSGLTAAKRLFVSFAVIKMA